MKTKLRFGRMLRIPRMPLSYAKAMSGGIFLSHCAHALTQLSSEQRPKVSASAMMFMPLAEQNDVPRAAEWCTLSDHCIRRTFFMNEERIVSVWKSVASPTAATLPTCRNR